MASHKYGNPCTCGHHKDATPVQVSISATAAGVVTMGFNAKLAAIQMGPDAAESLAEGLVHHARAARHAAVEARKAKQLS